MSEKKWNTYFKVMFFIQSTFIIFLGICELYK